MKLSLRKGFSFGLTSGIITTLGLMVGLHSSTHSLLVVVGGVLMIAIADALSDAFGIHVSEEAENHHTTKQIWESTVATFFSKFSISLTFIVPILIFSLSTAVIIGVVWGLLLIAILSFRMAKQQKKKPYRIVLEHLGITVLVIIITHYLGSLVAMLY